MSAFLVRVRLPEREGRQPELKMSRFKERTAGKCEHFWLGSGSRKGREGSRTENEQFLKKELGGNVCVSGSGRHFGFGFYPREGDYPVLGICS